MDLRGCERSSHCIIPVSIPRYSRLFEQSSNKTPVCLNKAVAKATDHRSSTPSAPSSSSLFPNSCSPPSDCRNSNSESSIA